MRGGTSMMHKHSRRQPHLWSSVRLWRVLSALPLLAALLAQPHLAHAAYSATLSGNVATLTGDAADDRLVIDVETTGPMAGLLHHNRFIFGDPGFADNYDFNTGVANSQHLAAAPGTTLRSEEHTSELQSLRHLVC